MSDEDVLDITTIGDRAKGVRRTVGVRSRRHVLKNDMANGVIPKHLAVPERCDAYKGAYTLLRKFLEGNYPEALKQFDDDVEISGGDL